ncbi:MAG: MoxR family ATPase [Acidimicrobiales bacterium]|nr:MoxR family ATPase [Acidimicrobiales bacterium]MCB9392693.1 MoxR family ATPase [Acidimicrobiaceae bacterium]
MSLFTRPPAPATALAGPNADGLPAPTSHQVTAAGRLGTALVDTVATVVAGRRDIAEIAAACVLSRGHLLIEDIPGVGKTLLAQSIAAAVGGTFHRIQGTVDLLPGDVTGTLVPEGDAMRLRFRPGPIFAHVVVFDELNRTNPRTQAALLEAAEESTVTVDGTSHALPDPFFLVATQNPIDMAGTFRLGEGAVDRFAAVVSPGRPAFDDEVAVIAGRRGRRQLSEIDPVAAPEHLVAARATIEQVTITDGVSRWIVELLDATRRHPRVRLGASTRGGLAVAGLARAIAVMRGRPFVVPDDVATVVVPALAHRLLLVDGDGSTVAGRDVVAECLHQVRPPTA